MTSSAVAQAPEGPRAGGKPRALAGRCGSANWVCVARVCGKQCQRTFEPAPYDVEGDTLTLTAKTPSLQTFQFRRQSAEQAE